MARPDWPSRVHPELRPVLRIAPNFTFGPWTSALTRLLMGAVPLPGAGDVSVQVASTASGKHLVFTPARPRGAMLWLHGGGRIVGSPRADARTCLHLAQSCGLVVVAAQYRLAPKHPFPAALDDAVAAWQWLVVQAPSLGVMTDHLLVGGESAGGGLAAELTQRLHDEGGPQPCGQVLVYPMLDDRTATRRDLTEQDHLVWNNASNHYGWSSYLGTEPGTEPLPRYAAAARRTDLTGLPRAWLTVGDLDLFHTEVLAYADRLQQAGVTVALHALPGGFHGCFSIGRDTPPIVAMWASLAEFVDTTLPPATDGPGAGATRAPPR